MLPLGLARVEKSVRYLHEAFCALRVHQENEKPWHEAYPAPKDVSPKTITRAELLAVMKENGGSIPGRDFVLVDLRRMDHKGGTIRGSINLPAQSLYPSIPTLHEIFKAAGVRKVIWYCGESGLY
ncbi:hypothetical protein DL768_009265 [Monosporascus sp. mg162]|nr:hypothetical protein DL768_009265 [Monosporascus sp. mg162]